VHQKCSNYALTNLLFGLCRSMWIIDLLVILFSPYPEALAHPSTFEVPQTRKCTLIFHSSAMFTLDSHLSLLRILGVCQTWSLTNVALVPNLVIQTHIWRSHIVGYSLPSSKTFNTHITMLIHTCSFANGLPMKSLYLSSFPWSLTYVCKNTQLFLKRLIV